VGRPSASSRVPAKARIAALNPTLYTEQEAAIQRSGTVAALSLTLSHYHTLTLSHSRTPPQLARALKLKVAKMVVNTEVKEEPGAAAAAVQKGKAKKDFKQPAATGRAAPLPEEKVEDEPEAGADISNVLTPKP